MERINAVPLLERKRFSMVLKNRQSGIKQNSREGKKTNDPSFLNAYFLSLLQKYKAVLEDSSKTWAEKNYVYLISHIILKLIVC